MSVKWQRSTDAISSARGIVRGWICRLDRNHGQEFDLWLAQRRSERVRIAGELQDTALQRTT